MSEQRQPISPVTRPRAAAREAYNKIARWYDLFEGTFERPYVNMGLQRLDVREGETVLEIGFGTGYGLLRLAAAAGSEGKVYGLDISDEMLRMTQEAVDKAGLTDRVELTRGDATAMPYPPGTMDAIFSTFMLELFDTPDIPAVLKECLRVLRSGGRLCVVSLSKEGKDGIMRRLYEWTHRQFPNAVDCRPIYVQQFMEEAGFDTIAAKRVSMWGLPVEIVLGRK